MKIETQEVLVLTESILNRVDGLLCEGFFFFKLLLLNFLSIVLPYIKIGVRGSCKANCGEKLCSVTKALKFVRKISCLT